MSFDHRIKQRIVSEGNPALIKEYGGSVNTAKNWLYRGIPKTIVDPSIGDLKSASILALEKKIRKLEKERDEWKAAVKLLESVNQSVKINLQGRHITDKKIRSNVLKAIDKASKTIGVKKSRELVGVSTARLNRWRVAGRKCEATGVGSCVRRHPNQLTGNEVKTMQHLVNSKQFSHFPIKSLHYHAKRKQLLSCCLGTWYKYVDLHGWSRPREKKKRGSKFKGQIKAYRANQFWHVDISYIQIKTGRTYYLQLIIDGYSRYVLAWSLDNKIRGANTKMLIKKAKARAKRLHPKFGTNPRSRTALVSDGGSENVCWAVRNYLQDSNVGLTIAQVDVDFPNILIECFFRSLKNNYLYFENIISRKDLVEKIKFYVNQHNNVIPHSALAGAVPREIYLKLWDADNETKLKANSRLAAKNRIEHNKLESCEGCWTK